eukprot:4889287-Prymnesium_polylepis.1
MVSQFTQGTPHPAQAVGSRAVEGGPAAGRSVRTQQSRASQFPTTELIVQENGSAAHARGNSKG